MGAYSSRRQIWIVWVRTGMCRPRCRLRRRFRQLATLERMGFSGRSSVAALAASNRSLTSGSKSRWPFAPWTPPGEQRRLQAFVAHPVRCFPYQDHRFSHGLVVDVPAFDLRHLIVRVAGLSQQLLKVTVLLRQCGHALFLVQLPNPPEAEALVVMYQFGFHEVLRSRYGHYVDGIIPGTHIADGGSILLRKRCKWRRYREGGTCCWS